MSAVSPEPGSSGRHNNAGGAHPYPQAWIMGVLLAIVAVLATGEGLYSWSLKNRLQALAGNIQIQDKNIEALQANLQEHEKNFTDLQNELISAQNALNGTQGQIQKTLKMAGDLAKQENHLTGQLGHLQHDQETTNGVVHSISSDLSGTKNDLTATNSTLQRTVGDLGVQSGLIARNAQELAELRRLGERTYVEFDLSKTGQPQRFGQANLSLQLKKTDTKHQRYTIELVSDDRVIEKKDKNPDEPVQFYQAGNRIPSEIVVNQIYKNRIMGYISVPLAKTAAPTQAAAAPVALQQNRP